MNSIQPALRRVARVAVPALALALPLAHAMAQTLPAAFKPTVLHKFGGENKGGAKPAVPPVLAADGRLYGHTFLGASPSAGAFWGQGTVYGLDTTGANHRFELLGSIYQGSTPLVPTADGGFLGAGNGAVPPGGNFWETAAVVFSIKDGKAVALPAPSFKPLGSMALDTAGNLYMGSGESASACGVNTTANILWRMNADRSYSKVVDFCQYEQQQGNKQLHPKGGAPVASVWSSKDQALYVLTGVSADGVVDSTLTTDYQGRSVGTLVKLSKAAIEEGVAGKGALDSSKVELLHTFMRARDGEPTAKGARVVGMVEVGEWLYGTTQFNAPTAGNAMDNRYGGTIWRVKKSDPKSFAVVHYFRGAGTVGLDGTAQADGSAPSGPLVLAADGNIYGTTATDGSTMNTPKTGLGTPYGAGTLYRIKVGATADHADDSYEVLHRFDMGSEGGSLTGLSAGAVAGGVQKLYGAANVGGDGQPVTTTATAPGNGTIFSFDVPLPTASFSEALTASVDTAAVGSSIHLSWSTTQASSCTASGAWSGAQQTSGSKVPVVLAVEGENSFSLTCSSQNDGQPVTSKVTVQATAVTQPGTGSGGSTETGNSSNGGGGGGPLSAWLLAPLAALAWARRRSLKSSPN
ncbi:MAG: choice-of-anchor tandem repeat GloVer-containing protein [Comamonas testosteroni]|uniref:choice-of-anchor tandem repeat GloVer-containing protein n=1 Tax=Comamonas testosteroni TaxID=285 RepID=UPI003D0CF34A